MAKNNNLTDFVTDIANVIRRKENVPVTQKINPQDFSNLIDGLPHLIDASARFPSMAVDINIIGGTVDKYVEFPTDFPWITLPDGTDFITPVVFKIDASITATTDGYASVSVYYRASEDEGGGTVLLLSAPDSGTDSATAYVVMTLAKPRPGSTYKPNLWAAADQGPDSEEPTMKIKITPYLVMMGENVLSLQTCKGEA